MVHDYMGMRLFWSGCGAEKSVEMVRDARLEVVESEVKKDEDNSKFLRVIARKPRFEETWQWLHVETHCYPTVKLWEKEAWVKRSE